MVKNSLFNLKIEEELPVLDYRLNRSGKRSRLSGILNTMTGFRLRFLFAVCAQVAATVCKTSVYLLLAWFIDTWLVGGDHSVPLFLVGFAFIGLSLVEGFSSFQANHQANYTAERVALRLRNNLYDQIQRLSFSYHDKVDTGDLIQRVTSDVDAVRRFFSEQAIGIGRIFFLYIINWVAIARIDLQLALTTMVIVPLIFVMALFFFSKISKSYEAYQVQDAQLSSLLQENLTGVRVVKAFARQDYEIEKYRRENEKKYKLGSKLILIESLFWPSTDMLCGMQIVISFYLGASAAIAGRITLGEFIAFQALLNWVIWPIRNMGRLIVQMSRSLVSFERVNTVLAEQQEELRQGEKAPEPFLSKQITFDNVSFSYDEKNKVLDEVSFTAEAGHTIALLGSTGSGKSSLLALIPRFYEYQSGSIQLDGMELNQIRKEDLRRNIGIVEQEPFLFSCTIAENIAYGVERDVNREEIMQAAKDAAIHESIMAFEKGYDTLVGERGVTLSGGQKQRVALARALLKNPRVLILDDATSSVDTDTEVEIRTALSRLMKHCTTFIIAHRIQSIMHADLILVMDKGKVIQSGTHDSLIQETGMYQRIFDIQTRIEADLEKEISDAG